MGSILLIMLIAFLIYKMRQNQKKHSSTSTEQDLNTNPNEVTVEEFNKTDPDIQNYHFVEKGQK